LRMFLKTLLMVDLSYGINQINNTFDLFWALVIEQTLNHG